MRSQSTHEDLWAAAMAAYGSVSQPDFNFVRRAADAHHLADLISNLERRYDLLETTDFNTDVGRVVRLRSGDEKLVLWLSFVGPYAALVRIGPSGHDEPVVIDGVSGMEQTIVRIARQYGLELLARQQLEQPAILVLQNASPERTRMFNVLFSDTDFLPWEHVPD
jgi:hypothetical protein